jgi:hypothetical protein
VRHCLLAMPSQLGRASICREHRNGSTPVRHFRLRSSTGAGIDVARPHGLAHDSAKLADVLTDLVPALVSRGTVVDR